MMKPLMVQKNKQAGFTLVEIIIVLAITSSMLVIALAGQRQLRSSATFTAAVDKIIASIADARNQALSGVNATPGAGVGTIPASCVDSNGRAVPLAGTAYFAGTRWSTSALTTTQAIDTWLNTNNNGAAGACINATQRQIVGVPVALTVRQSTSATVGAQIVFLRRAGDIAVCTIPTTVVDPSADYANETCAAGQNGPMTLRVTDTDGNTALIKIDPATGLASR